MNTEWKTQVENALEQFTDQEMVEAVTLLKDDPNKAATEGSKLGNFIIMQGMKNKSLGRTEVTEYIKNAVYKNVALRWLKK